MSEPRIHPTAIISSRAELDGSVTVGPYSIIGEHVQIGAGSTVAAHVVIDGHTRIGQHNHIFQFNSIGAIPQDKKYAGEPCRLEIGDHNTIREFCTLNIGSPGDTGVTRVGHNNWIMAYVHIAHDCVVGNHTVLANNATLAGHVHVGDHVTLGGLSGVHQFVKIGAQAMVGFASAITQDVPPYMLVDGNPLQVRGINSVGLKRRGLTAQQISAVKQMHKLLYREGLTFEQAKAAIAGLVTSMPEAAEQAAQMSDFLAQATRGIAR
jgi:UDP-N-acetylglucosamine acyltransferase